MSSISPNPPANTQKLSLAAVFEHAEKSMGIVTMGGKWLTVNTSFLKILGYEDSAKLPLIWQDTIAAADQTACNNCLEQALNTPGLTVAREVQIVRADAKQSRAKLEIAKLDDSCYPGSTALLLSLEPVLPVENTDQELDLLHFAINRIQESVFLIGEKGNFSYVNDEACRSVGFSREELLQNMSIVDLNPNFDESGWRNHWAQLKQEQSLSFETTHQRRNGEIFPVVATANIFELEGKAHNMVHARDLTNHKKQESHIKYLAYFDTLTGLPNRKLIFKKLDLAVKEAQIKNKLLAVLYLDLNRFKLVNDSFGHSTGDKILKLIAKLLSETLESADIIGRVGNDEFLVYLRDQRSPEDVLLVAERIMTHLSKPLYIDDNAVQVNMSIGVSLLPKDSSDTTELVKFANSALSYTNINQGNQVHFYCADLDTAMNERLNLENDLHLAIERNELSLVYQPKANLKTGKFIGCEALLRWKHAKKGNIPPDKFIHLAEESGLIYDMGLWVLQNACEQTKKWNASSEEPFFVSINVSQRQLESPRFLDDVKEVLSTTGCPPNLIELEVTESVAMTDPDATIKKLNALSRLGIKFAMDDYGTGYSNLAYLNKLPFDHLKIDRSLIIDIPEDENASSIVKASITMAQELNLKVVVEGVETEAQKEFLILNHCDEIQGFLFSKPLPPEELEKFLKET